MSPDEMEQRIAAVRAEQAAEALLAARLGAADPRGYIGYRLGGEQGQTAHDWDYNYQCLRCGRFEHDPGIGEPCTGTGHPMVICCAEHSAELAAAAVADYRSSRRETEATATLEAEVSRLRAALAMTTDALDVWVTGSHRVVDGRCPHRSDGPCTSHRVVAEARAALAAAPVAPAPAATERCAACGHETRFHAEGQCDCEGDGKAGLCPCPEPRR